MYVYNSMQFLLAMKRAMAAAPTMAATLIFNKVAKSCVQVMAPPGKHSVMHPAEDNTLTHDPLVAPAFAT